MGEENIELPEGNNKSETEKYIEDLINSIESELPKHVNYTTGIIVDDERNLLIIKNGKLHVGRDENNAKEIKEYVKDANAGYLINALYVLKQMLASYKDLWSGKIEREAKKALNEII
ncbi:hypothetical protein SIFV0032 [Sulfolobus islandicus filamentous virus]|uniref:Uncharacterized protein 32 n=1 Tax=Sulfolobus islandicus filamentous virus (isolate Iceland/Hveragerdi) TaxID=654908 RepID=Y032_SIFVH|nr:hypothetical protein SIFV0032 [Sulfolobus islandicus filamentous virus]Q914J8.1 RecName: Full=Uncharacterized protein 32 [Sulfolobus islandicus filamentous virus (isolate Hveragerdi)]AAL27743.1 hypothetical protein [Sulfolobus islandicus filamentous virus]